MNSTVSGDSEEVVTIDTSAVLDKKGVEVYHLHDVYAFPACTWHGDLYIQDGACHLCRLRIDKKRLDNIDQAIETFKEASKMRLGLKGSLRAMVDAKFVKDFEAQAFRALIAFKCASGENVSIMRFDWPLPVDDACVRAHWVGGKPAIGFCMKCERRWGAEQPSISQACSQCQQ